jgi:tetratricopeptide (TPR) repeat protein
VVEYCFSFFGVFLKLDRKIMSQQWFHKVNGWQVESISSRKLRYGAQRGMVSTYVGPILLAFIIILAAQLSAVKYGFCAEESPANDSASASNVSADLEKKIYQSVKDFEYSDQVASDVVKMIQPWKCDVLYQKLSHAEEDVKQKKISLTQYAQVEDEVVNQLARTIKKEVAPTDTNVEGNWKYFDLALVVKDKKAHCLSYTQLFYVLGNSMGLKTQAIEVLEHSNLQMPERVGHVVCIASLHNDKSMQVDLTLRDCVSKEYSFTEQYANEGNGWELKDKNNPLKIHPRIQQLDKNGLVAGIYSNRGSVDVQTGKLAEAISDCTRALELNPKSAMTYCNRANAYSRSGKLTEAISDLSKAIELDPKFAMAYFGRGTNYRRAGKLTEAISDLSRAIELNPKFLMAYINRSAAYIRAGQLDNALSDCNKAIELNPNLAEAYGNRGAINAMLGKKEEAKNDLQKATQLNPRLKESAKRISEQYKLDL